MIDGCWQNWNYSFKKYISHNNNPKHKNLKNV